MPEPKEIESTCPLCNHPICDKLTEIYFDNNEDLDKTMKWFEDKFKEKKVSGLSFRRHFKEHVDPFLTKMVVLKNKKIVDLKKKTLEAKKENSMTFNMIKQMAWEFMLDLYVCEKEEMKDGKEKASFQRITKQFSELAKTYREYYQMELDIIGMGKSEEEQKSSMEMFVAGMLKQAMISLEEYPDAQERLADFISINLNDKRKDKDEVVVEEEDGL